MQKILAEFLKWRGLHVLYFSTPCSKIVIKADPKEMGERLSLSTIYSNLYLFSIKRNTIQQEENASYHYMNI